MTALWLFVWKRPLGRDNWFIAPHQSWPFSASLLSLGTLLILGGLSALSAYDRFQRAKTRPEEIISMRMSLGALILLATVMPWTLLGPRAISGVYIVSATWSDISNQYFSTAYRIENARDFTRNYAVEQRDYDVVKSHVATHPPGAVLFYYGARRIYENVPFIHSILTTVAPGITAASTPSVGNLIRKQLIRSNARDMKAPVFSDDAVGGAIWCAVLLSLSVGLTVPAVYKLAAGTSSTRLSETPVSETPEHNERARESRGLLGAALFALAPTTMLFAFTLDALMACVLAWSLVLVARSLSSETTKIGTTLFAGMLIGVASFLSFGALAIWGLLVFAYAIVWFCDAGSARRKRLSSGFVLILVGFLGLWLALCVVFPMQPLAIYGRAMQAHHAATLTSRSQAGWAYLNLFFFALFGGWPLVFGVLSGARSWWKTRHNANWNAAAVLGVASVLTCLLLSLSGNVRGETERLWYFLLPPLAAFAAAHLIEYSNPAKGRFCTLLIGLQLLQTLLMASALAPLVRAY